MASQKSPPPQSTKAFLPPVPILLAASTRNPTTKLKPKSHCQFSYNPLPHHVQTRHATIISAVTEPPPPPQRRSSATTTKPTLDNILHPRGTRRYIFFGGKGGVGKTSASAAVAVHSASVGLSTLIISTDPAHSLGDALCFDLSDGQVHRVDDDLPLYAVESDTREAVNRFRELVASISASDTADKSSETESGWASVAERLGLREFSDVLETIPPGADELIALVAVLDVVEMEHPDVYFDRVIIDTAPTGHTLRFLAFPDFLDKFLTQALSLRKKLNNAGGVLGSMTKMFMGGGKVDMNQALETASERVSIYRDKMITLAQLFRDPSRTEFIVVTIATGLAVEESKRLIQHLWDDGIWVRHVVINQVLPPGDDSIGKYLARVRKGQAREISFATERIGDEFGLSVSLVPRFDTEVRGVYGLAALGKIGFRTQLRNSYGKLFDTSVRVSAGGNPNCLFTFVGGKGGVGKTSIASALGVTLAEEGFKTLVLSTDPAHSLGDALRYDLLAKGIVRIDDAQGELFALEIDTVGAVRDFQALAREFVAEGRRGAGVDMARKLGLEEFASLLDNAPPGIDELVALTQVVELVRFGDFDRVVVDTAPTGHTLRLLSFPEFLDAFLGKIIRLKERLDSGIEALRSVLGRKDSADAVDKAAKGVGKLRENMAELRDLVADSARTQFAIVTVPTGLAMAESERLVMSLKRDGVSVRNLIINQVVPDGSAAAFVERIVNEQEKCIGDLVDGCLEKNISVAEVPYFDVEVRGVYGLKAMAAAMFSVDGES